ncbi:MAG TPA: 50S ribosomal protein L10 [Actinomycetota bacterium]|nr:50S ribosomal protein L10 [Actinomycetota bacterium]
MPKPEKVEAIEELVGDFTSSQAALLASFRGLKVAELTELRRALTPTQTEFKVVKNTLARIAAREAGMEALVPLLEGSTAIAFVKGDPVAAAKGLDEVAKKYPALVVKGGLMDGKVLTPERALALASVKPREVLLAGLAGAIKSPVATVVGMVAAPVRSLAYAFGAYRDKLSGGDTPPAAEPEAA